MRFFLNQTGNFIPSGIKIHDYIPSPALQPYIDGFRIIECEELIINRVLPGIVPVLALRLKGNISLQNESLPTYTLSGLRKTPRLIQYNPGTSNLLILFKEGGINAFFDIPAHEFFNESIALDNLVDITALEDQLGNATDCISVAENFLLQQLKRRKPDQLILTATREIKQQQGNLNISQLASSLYISQDAFEKRFRKVIGTTPKQFASLVRMQAIVKNYSSKDFTDLALEAGYFDQAHFNKAFKQFTGLTPSSFFNTPPQW
ncbi:helix-turn-helix transcriptional regulator [Chitinophaga sp.]|uniref:helix-turn-helix transcriptional regulator n=1 Tax=Chitinophaga sp. TaxID=1869181 RepID=UPI0031D1429F